MLKVKKNFTMSNITDLLTMVHQVPLDPFSTCFSALNFSHPPEVIALLAPTLMSPSHGSLISCVFIDSVY